MMPSRASLLGSSPQMRGAQTGEITPQVRTRIIPADAGSTWTRRA